MEFNTLAAFRASSTKCHVNIAQGRNHGRNLVQPRWVGLRGIGGFWHRACIQLKNNSSRQVKLKTKTA